MRKPTKSVQLFQNHYDRESRILIVDSDEIIAKFFKIHLNKFFSKVSVTGNAREALEWFKKEAFDLIITESNLPRISGNQFVKRIRKLDAKVPIILMTATSNEEMQRPHPEADGVLRKPFTMDEFHDCLKQGLMKKEGFKHLSWLHEDAVEQENTPTKNLHPTKRNAA